MMNVKNMEVGLSPPYGDGMIEQAEHEIQGTFSPPYGDGIVVLPFLVGIEWFSPPYGDGILNISQNIAKLKSQRLENVHFIAMMCFCAEKNGHKFIQPALCAGRFHGMMLIMDLIKRSVVLC